jgi:hypothetical protein
VKRPGNFPTNPSAERPPSQIALLVLPLLAGFGTIISVIGGRVISSGAMPAVECRWFRWTGIPCPGCGGTRCLVACGRFDFGAAFCWNPLVALIATTFMVWSAMAFLTPRAAEQASMRVAGFFTSRRIAILVALNWLYLCWALRR